MTEPFSHKKIIARIMLYTYNILSKIHFADIYPAAYLCTWQQEIPV